MLKQIEGSRAVAEGVAMCRPQVICAYPLTPQTTATPDRPSPSQNQAAIETDHFLGLTVERSSYIRTNDLL